MVAVLCVLVDGGVGAALSEEGRRGRRRVREVHLWCPLGSTLLGSSFFFVLFFRFFVLVLGPSVACSVACRGLDGPPHKTV